MGNLSEATVAFIGLGSIGQHLAGHLHEAGAKVRVYNRSSEKQDSWIAGHPGVVGSSSAREAAAGASFVISCVGDDDDLKHVYFGADGVFASLQPDACVIDHTTASDQIAVQLEAAAQSAHGYFVDAPVSGGSTGAQNRALSIMAGGTLDAYAKAEPILRLYGRNVSHIGSAGSGQLCKMVNQVCIAGVLEGLAEGLGLAKAAGLDPDVVLKTISGGAAGSWQMNNRSSFMLAGSYPAGFAAKLMHKDLGLSLSAAESRSVVLPVAKAVEGLYSELISKGLGGEDFSNLFRLVSNNLNGEDDH